METRGWTLDSCLFALVKPQCRRDPSNIQDKQKKRKGHSAHSVEHSPYNNPCTPSGMALCELLAIWAYSKLIVLLSEDRQTRV